MIIAGVSSFHFGFLYPFVNSISKICSYFCHLEGKTLEKTLEYQTEEVCPYTLFEKLRNTDFNHFIKG